MIVTRYTLKDSGNSPQGNAEVGLGTDAFGCLRDIRPGALKGAMAMKTFLVIECDTEFHTVFVHQVTREFTADPDANRGVAYHRSASQSSEIADPPSPEFYGKLDALLLTAGKLADAAPITPVVEQPEAQPAA